MTHYRVRRERLMPMLERFIDGLACYTPFQNMAVVWILLGWAGCVIAALTLGLALFRLLRVRLHQAELVCLGFVAGSAVLSLAVLGIAAVGLAFRGVFLSMAALTLVTLVWFRRSLLPRERADLPRIAVAWKILFAAGLLAYGTLQFRQALSPEMSPDGMAYHLGLVNQFDHAHGLVRIENIYAALPQGIEMLYLFGFSIGRNSTGSLIHFTFLVDLALLLALYGRRFGFPAGGIVAGLLVFASPLVGADGTAAYNDVGLAAVMFAAVYLLALWWKAKSAGLLIACCAVSGFALAVKYTAVCFALFVVAVIAFGLRGRPVRRLLPVSLLAVLALSVSVAPYLIRNAIWFDNPIAFFGNSIFRNPYFHVSFERDYIANQAHLNGLEWEDMPLQLTLGGTKVEGSFGAAFLAAPLLLAGVFRPQGRFLLLAILAAGLPFPHDRSTRFLIPALPMIALALTFVLSRFRGSRPLLAMLAVVQMVFCWPSLLNRFDPYAGWRLFHVPWQVAFGIVPEDAWLRHSSEEYMATREIDRLLPAAEPVFSMGSELARSYSYRLVVVSFESAYGEKLTDLFYSCWNSPENGRLRWHFRFPSALVRDVRVVQKGASRNNSWSVNEVQFESGDVPSSASAHGQPYAFPNPWDAGLAFDHRAVTRWRSWEPLRPGMRLGMRFDHPIAIDGVTVESIRDEWDTRLALQILDERGNWIDEPPPVLEIAPAVDLRKQAAQELKYQGIHYVLLSRLQWPGEDLIAAAAAWGMSPVFATRHYVLMRID
jgi:hypothetical protein